MAICINALYNDLLEDLGFAYDTDLTLYPWDSPSVAAKKALAASFVKKYHGDKVLQDANDAALDKFLAVNEQCGAWQLRLDSMLDEYLWGQFKYWSWKYFDGNAVEPLGLSVDTALANGRNGPGASIGTRVKSFYTKLFDSSLACTKPGLLGMYANYVSQYPLWAEAEKHRRTLRGAPVVVAGSRMSFVPKNAKISRIVCTEPILNMFCQLGAGVVFENRLRSFFKVDLSEQPLHNRAMALEGSRDGSLSTIDLSSASDSISLKLLELIVPKPVLDVLKYLRSPVVQTPRGEVELKMVSTMGNGFTFPLQTAIFSCVVAAAFDVAGIERINNAERYCVRDGICYPPRRPNWGVFGDDIIVPTEVTRLVLRLLGILGFSVNSDKTFSEGHFRESCGLDAWKGVDIRGVYAKTLGSAQDRLATLNRLLLWIDRHGIPLPLTVGRLLRSVPRNVVPPWESEVAGIRLPYNLARRYRSIPRSRLGSFAYKRWVPRQSFAEAIETTSGDWLFRVPGEESRRVANPDGLYISFLVGECRSYDAKRKAGPLFLLEREDGWAPASTHASYRIGLAPAGKVRYDKRTAIAPSWDRSPAVRCPYKAALEEAPGVTPALLTTLVSAW